MFLKTKTIKNLLIHTEELSEAEYQHIVSNFSGFNISFLKTNENSFSFIKEEHQVHTLNFFDKIFGIKSRLKVKTRLNINETILISKDKLFLKEAIKEGIGTIYVNVNQLMYEDIGRLSDFLISSIYDLKKLTIFQEEFIGFYSEVQSIFPRLPKHYGTSFYFEFIYEKPEKKPIRIISGGRYYGSKHSNYKLHQLSYRIRQSKINASQNPIFIDIFTGLISTLIINHENLYITRVPNRPSDPDRFKKIVEGICSEIDEFKDISNSIMCKHDYPKQKAQSGKDGRESNVKNVFKITETNLQNKHIVIIDDIFTTGATIYECAMKYLEAGAEKVSVVVLSVNQHPDGSFMNDKIKCSACNGEMLLKLNSRNNNIFFGCSNYNRSGCKNNHDFLSGWLRLIEEDEPSLIQNEDIQF